MVQENTADSPNQKKVSIPTHSKSQHMVIWGTAEPSATQAWERSFEEQFIVVNSTFKKSN